MDMIYYRLDQPAYDLGLRSKWPSLEWLLQEYDVDNLSITSKDSLECLKSVVHTFDHEVNFLGEGTYVRFYQLKMKDVAGCN